MPERAPVSRSFSERRYPFKPKEKTEPLLTDEFAQQIHEISSLLAPDLPVASLIAYSEKKRKKIIHEITSEKSIKLSTMKRIPKSNSNQIENYAAAIAILEARLGRLGALPWAPAIWTDLFEPESETELAVSQKKVLIDALTGTLTRSKDKFSNKWLDPLNIVADLRAIEVIEDDSGEFQATRTQIFLAKAF